MIQHYAQLISRRVVPGTPREWRKGKHTAIHDVRLLTKDDHQPTTQYVPGEPLILELTIDTDGTPGMSLELFLTDASRTRIGVASTYSFHGQTLPEKKGIYRATIKLDPLWLAAGHYAFDVATTIPSADFWDLSSRICRRIRSSIFECTWIPVGFQAVIRIRFPYITVSPGSGVCKACPKTCGSRAE